MWKKERHLFDIYNGTIASDEMVRNVLSARQAEEDAKAAFFTHLSLQVLLLIEKGQKQ